MYKISLLFAFALIPYCSFGQKKSQDCKKIKDGRFFSYSKEAKVWTEILRSGTVHQEINLKTNDTAFYQVKWLTPCSFTMELIRRTKPFETGEESFVRSLKTTIEILKVTKEYFTYKAVLSSVLYQKQTTFSDTAWYKMR